MRWMGFSVLISLTAGILAWGVSDRLEQRNDFCNACHLPGGTPLCTSRSAATSTA